MKVALVCGSLGDRSANAAMLTVASRRLEAAGHEAHQVDFIHSMPPFDPALVDEAPAAVTEFRRQLRGSDAVLIAAPEYAAGVAGSTKNALDWLVGDSTIYRKVMGVASAGSTGGAFAIEHLVRTISWQGGWVLATLGVAAPRTKTDEHGEYNDPATIGEIHAWVDVIDRAVSGSSSDRFERLAGVVSQYGIDPERFGDVD